MRFIERASIKRKQMLIILLITSVALFIACMAFGAYEVITFRKTMLVNITTLAEIVGDNAAAALDFDDPHAADETLKQLRAEPNIVGACIYDKSGRVFAVFDRPGDGRIMKPPPFQMEGHNFGRQDLTLFDPIDYKGDVIGTVYIATDMQALYSRLERYAAIAGGVFVITMLIALALSARLQRLVSDPILRLVETTRAVARDKDYSIRVARRSHDEIGELMDGFNEMLIQIQERDAVLQRAQGELEQRVRDRTQELASSLSLVHATLESTADGIMVADGVGKAINWNQKFMEMWQIPREVMESADERRMLELAAAQLKDPAQFTAKVEELYGHMDQESFDLLEFKDGRMFERYSKPQRIGERCVGRVWSFRDVTERKRSEQQLQASLEQLRLKTALFEALVNSSIDGVLVVDEQYRKILQTRRFDELLKIPPQIAEQVDDAEQLKFVADSTQNPEQFVSKVSYLNSHPDETSRDEIEFKDGRILDRYSAPVMGTDKKNYGRIWMFRDITQRKQAEAELAAERDLLGTLLENSPDMIYFKDLHSRFLRTSRMHIERLGAKQADEILGKGDFDFFTEEHARHAFQDEQEIIRTGQPVIGKIEKETWENGRTGWVLTSKMPLRNKHGEIIGTFGISKDISAIKEAEARLEQVHRQLLETSRMAGMAEVATSVLHNVGNVLNSVNVSCSVVADRVHKSKVTNLSRAVALMREHEHDLAGFFTADPKGRQLPGYLNGLATHLATEQGEILEELSHLSTNIDHIKEIVAMQQSYSKVSGVRELLPAGELVEDALRMNGAAFERHQVKVIREYAETPLVMAEKHKVLQILINLLRNAKYACEDNGHPDKQVIVRVKPGDGNHVRIMVIDNGVGIPAENLTRIFEHGFTTRKEGHGFGLHSGALAAKDLGGSLTVASDGPGRGASFTLELPCQPKEGAI